MHCFRNSVLFYSQRKKKDCSISTHRGQSGRSAPEGQLTCIKLSYTRNDLHSYLQRYGRGIVTYGGFRCEVLTCVVTRLPASRSIN